MRLHQVTTRIGFALTRARFGIKTVAAAYVLGLFAGAFMVHFGNGFALRYRDRLVGDAVKTSTILQRSQKGNRLAAASLDASGNAAAGLVSLLAGYCVPAGYWIALERGWIGGIVSVDGDHRSRLKGVHEAFYYVVTLVLQLVPYTLVGGAGVNLGIAAFTNPAIPIYQGPRLRWLRIPVEAIRDACWIYLIALPMFAVASLFEFTM
jgi:hypothetical protein